MLDSSAFFHPGAETGEKLVDIGTLRNCVSSRSHVDYISVKWILCRVFVSLGSHSGGLDGARISVFNKRHVILHHDSPLFVYRNRPLTVVQDEMENGR